MITGGDEMDIKKMDESMVFSDQTLTKRVLFADENVLSFMLNLKAGQTLPSHRHEQSTVVYTVMSGSGEIKVDNETARIEKGFVGMAKGEDDFEIPTITEDMSLLVTISPNPSNQLYRKEFG